MSVQNLEIRRVRRLLRETARIAEHASLTGSLEKGSRLAVRQYNSIRSHLEEVEAIPHDLFPELDEDESSFDELGVAAKLLDGYLEEDEPGSPETGGGKHKRFEIKIGGASGGLTDLGDLKNLGEIIRSQLPEIMRQYTCCTPTPPVPPTPPVAPAPPTPPVHENSFGAAEESEPKPAGANDPINALIGRLRNEDLSESERSEIALEIVRLSRAGE